VRLLLIVLALMTGGAIAATAKPLPRSVLVITQSSPSSGGAIAMFAAFGSDPNVNSTSRIAVYTEHLDLNRFPSPQHQQLARSYFRDKYRETPIGVVIVDGTVALDLVLSWRGEMWSEVPVVFYGVDEASAAQLNLPPNVTGFVAHQTFRGMVDAARMLVPGLKRVALVGDPPERDAYRRNYRQEIATLAPEIELIDLTGLAVTEVKKRVAVLPDDAAVLYTAIFVDGAGVVHTPQSALLAISVVTSRPIVTDVESQLGYGAVGGFVYSLASAAREGVRLAVRILDGENASQIPVAKIDLNKPIFDARELKRWNIREDSLPAGSEIRFRELTAWDQYRWQIMLVAAVLLIQTALIIGLFYEHRRRQTAESVSRSAMGRLAHMNRVATAGELSASIAHEVNQPLAAIVAYAGASLRFLTRPTPDVDEARAALENVITAGHRAGEVVGSVRAMFKHDSEIKTPLDLNDIIQDVLGLDRGELQAQGIIVQTGLSRPLPLVLGNGGQLQQVILNLVRNAADAMGSVSDRARLLRVTSAIHDPDGVLVSIEDSGAGIDPKDIERIFESFYTTKSQGMGMGLSICRSIIEAHHGRLWASSGVGYGAVLNVLLPVVRPGVEE
jgi:signal transduction histidine kinase